VGQAQEKLDPADSQGLIWQLLQVEQKLFHIEQFGRLIGIKWLLVDCCRAPVIKGLSFGAINAMGASPDNPWDIGYPRDSG
jgi:hypothetical protein